MLSENFEEKLFTRILKNEKKIGDFVALEEQEFTIDETQAHIFNPRPTKNLIKCLEKTVYCTWLLCFQIEKQSN